MGRITCPVCLNCGVGLFADLEGGAALGDEFACLVAQFSFRKSDGAAAMADEALADERAFVGAANEAGFEFEGYLRCARRFMCEAHGMATEPVEHGGKEAAKNAPSPVDEIVARNEGSADISALRIRFEDMLAQCDCGWRFPIGIESWVCRVGQICRGQCVGLIKRMGV